MRGGDAEGDEPGKGILGAKRRPQAAHAEEDKKRHDRDGADEAKLLGDIGEDEIRGSLGQIEELLHAFHEAAAGEAAAAHGDERLADVIAGGRGRILGVAVRDGGRPACAGGARQP